MARNLVSAGLLPDTSDNRHEVAARAPEGLGVAPYPLASRRRCLGAVDTGAEPCALFDAGDSVA